MRELFCALLIVGISTLAYFPSLSGDFIVDDDVLLTNNYLIRDPHGLTRIWFSTDATDYWPLTNSLFWLQWRLWGMQPAGYHVTNLALHIAAALLLWGVLKKLSIPGEYLAALLFAVHPVNVASVAWISELKNALAMVLFLTSIWCYLKSEEAPPTGEERRQIWYWLSLLAFLFAMLSKGSVAVLPVMLLGLMWWKRGRITFTDLLRTVPFFVVAIVLTAVNLWFQTHGKQIAIRDASIMQRLLGAGAVPWFYLSKALAPIRLIFIYPQWQIEINDLLWWLPLVAALLVTLTLWLRRNSTQVIWVRPLLFTWLFFCCALLPVIGFSDFGYMRVSLVGDQYQHLALLSIVACFAAGWSVWEAHSGVIPRNAKRIFAVAIVGTLTFLTWQQNHLYADPIRLYDATIENNPDCWLIHNNLGVELRKRHLTEQAQRHLEQALRLYPNYSQARNNLGCVLLDLGRFEEAKLQFQKALELQPNLPTANLNLGETFQELNRPQDAIEQFRQAIRLNPYGWIEYLDLGKSLKQIGQLPEAVDAFRQSTKVKPDNFEAYVYLGDALEQVGRFSEAIPSYQDALTLSPNDALVHHSLAIALAETGNLEEAIKHYQRAVELRPDFAEAHYNFGAALMRADRPEAALAQFREVLRLSPNDIEAAMGIASTLAQLGRSIEAAAAAQKALEIARTQKQTEQIQQIEAWLQAHPTGSPP